MNQNAKRIAVVLVKSLHVRVDHDASSEVIAGLKEGDEVEVTATWGNSESVWAQLGEGRWAAMKYDGQTLMKFKE